MKKSKTCKVVKNFEVQDSETELTYVVQIAEYEPATPATLNEPAFGCEIDYGAVWVKGDVEKMELFSRADTWYTDEGHRIHQLIIAALKAHFEN